MLFFINTYIIIMNKKICNECNIEKEKKDFYKKNKKCRNCLNEKLKSSLSHRFHNSKRSAKERNYDFKLTKEEYGKITNNNCIYCNRIDGNKYGKFVGIDRVNNDNGYVLGNIVPTCKICNKMKGTLTYYEFIESCSIIHKKNHNKFM